MMVTIMIVMTTSEKDEDEDEDDEEIGVCVGATVDTRGTEMSDGCNKVSIENSQDLSSTFDQKFLGKIASPIFVCLIFIHQQLLNFGLRSLIIQRCLLIIYQTSNSINQSKTTQLTGFSVNCTYLKIPI